MKPSPPIDSFRDDYFFLSNFYPCVVILDDILYASVEHAYQAAKTTNVAERKRIEEAATAADAKTLGKHVTLRPDWNEIRISTMKVLLRQKFRRGSKLAKQLMETGSRELIEGNTWGDRFWGICKGRGSNHLGQLLMRRRATLISLESSDKLEADKLKATLSKEIQPLIPAESTISRNERASTVLHSSLERVTSITQDNEFPSFPRYIGVIVRHEKLTARKIASNAEASFVLEQEWPTLTSIVRGEISDIDNIESLTRDKIEELRARCCALADEVTRHAERLEGILARKKLVHIRSIDPTPQAPLAGSRYTIGKIEPRPRGKLTQRPPKGDGGGTGYRLAKRDKLHAKKQGTTPSKGDEYGWLNKALRDEKD